MPEQNVARYTVAGIICFLVMILKLRANEGFRKRVIIAAAKQFIAFCGLEKSR